MMQIAFSTEDVAKIRFAISPMLTTVLSVRSLLHPQQTEPMRDWLETMRAQLGDVDLPAFRHFHLWGDYTVDFMLPFPEKTQPKFEDELQQIANVPLATIEAEIALMMEHGMLTSADMPRYKNLAALQAQVVDELAYVWDVAMRPHWDSIHAVLEGDLMHHSRELMVGGAVSMFAGLNSYMKLEASDLLSIYTRTHSPNPIDPQGQGLVLIPNLISYCGIWVQTLEGKPPIISYSAYGAGTWRQRTAPPSQAMHILFGDNRSRLLHALMTPTSTKDLALKLDLTPGAISQQLSQLKDAGLVDANRAGRAVYYYLNQRGEQLLNLLSTA